MAVKKKGKLAAMQARTSAQDMPADNPGPGFSMPDSISHIWLAGLGALARAQAEGPRLLESLIADGKRVQSGGKISAPAAPTSMATSLARSAGESLGRQASESWNNLESVFRDRVGKALAQLDVPSASKLNEISAQVQSLQERISALEMTAKHHATGESGSVAKSVTQARARAGSRKKPKGQA
jgi:poly(hydroxyalkanoate) granule-associated protein